MMSYSEVLFEGDRLVDSLKGARNRSSVLKLTVLSIRSQLMDVPIFVFEGVDDKSVYSQWVRRLRPEMKYEPLPASGKDQVLMFWDSLLKDKDGLIENIFIFVDRDFDDLKGREHHENIFMTDFYAVENYVVSEAVLDDILKNELHCHGVPSVRAVVVERFRQVYSSFLDVVSALNFKIYCARKLKVEIDGLPKKISKIALVTLEDVLPLDEACENSLRMSREPTAQELEQLIEMFGQLDPSSRFRGKFLLMFFYKWVELLSLERVKQETELLAGVEVVSKVGSSHSSIGYLASRSEIPVGLDKFLGQVTC